MAIELPNGRTVSFPRVPDKFAKEDDLRAFLQDLIGAMEAGYGKQFDNAARIAGEAVTTAGDVLGPATNSADYVPQWNGADSKLLKNGLAVGTGANNLLQLDGSAKIPAVDGSLITGIVFPGLTSISQVATGLCYTIGDVLLQSNDAEATSTSVTPELKKEMKYLGNGPVTMRIKFDIKNNTTDPTYGQIYKNGVAFGTQQSRGASTYQTFSEDLSFTTNDLIQVYIWRGGGATSYIQNFRIYNDPTTFQFAPMFYNTLT